MKTKKVFLFSLFRHKKTVNKELSPTKLRDAPLINQLALQTTNKQTNKYFTVQTYILYIIYYYHNLLHVMTVRRVLL